MGLRTGFDRIEILGERYENDIILHVDHSFTMRCNKLSKPLRSAYSHTHLSESEIEPLLEEDSEIIIVRTDQYGGFPFTPGAREMMEGHGVIMDRPLDPLLLLKRSLAERRRVVVVLHLTC